MPPPKLGLKLDDRVAAVPGESLHRPDEHPLQAFGQEGPPEELNGLAVLGNSFTNVDLPEVRGKLRLLVATARYVFVGARDLAPRLELSGGLTLDGRSRALSLLVAHLLIEAQAQELHLHLLDVARLWRRHRRKEARGGVEGTVSVVARERLLVSPAVANITKLADECALRLAEHLPEDAVPGVPHELEQRRRIPLGEGPIGLLAGVADKLVRFLESPLLVKVRELSIDEGGEPHLELLKGFADPFLVADGHRLVLPE